MAATFTIYPAIDIRGGKCVRLVQGDYNKETVYHNNPVEAARSWEAQGAEWIHLVDLDGAKAGHPVNEAVIGEIAASVSIPVQVGGGLRTEEDVKRLLSLGVKRVILGTAAIEDRRLVQELLKKYPGQIVMGLDAREGYVATRGWLETSTVKVEDLTLELAGYGADTFIFTDISRDGMMEGPNLDAIVKLARHSGCNVIASGGVSSMEDLERLAAASSAGVSGAIVGKALYTGTIGLKRALDQTKFKNSR